MSCDFTSVWSKVLAQYTSKYEIGVFDSFKIDKKFSKEFDTFIFPCCQKNLVRIKFVNHTIYKLDIDYTDIKSLVNKPHKYIVIFDCNLSSLFMVNHPPFPNNPLFLKKISRSSLFNDEFTWPSSLTKSKLKVVDYQTNHSIYQSLIMELIEKSCKEIHNMDILQNLYAKKDDDIIVKMSEIDINGKLNLEFLRNVILACLYLKILYRIHFSNPILNEYPDFCQILHEVKKAKLLHENIVDTKIQCLICHQCVNFCKIFGNKYNICRFCLYSSIPDLEIVDLRKKIIDFENKLRLMGLKEIDIFKLRCQNSN